MKPLKYAVVLNPDTLSEDTEPDFSFRYVDISNVDSQGRISIGEALSFARAPSRARRLTRNGDCVISTVRTYLKAIGKVGHDAPELVFSTGFAVLRPRAEVRSNFLFYALQAESFIQEVIAHSKGIGYPAIAPSELGRLPIALPSYAEQSAIADFLDRETRKIDALIAKKERLIELFEEKRAALITQAVTRGLDPNVPMKDSGEDWLGQIPSHWTAKQLKWAIMFQRGHDLPSDEREEGQVPVVSSSGISSMHSQPIAKAPGIVTGRYGTIGHFHLITEDYWPLNTTLYSIDLRGNESRFLRYMLIHLSPLFLLNAVKSAVPGVDRNDIHPIKTAVPPLQEQRQLADSLDAKSAEIDRLTAKIRDAIAKLREYRTALISAAVTGKIDVRNLRDITSSR